MRSPAALEPGEPREPRTEDRTDLRSRETLLAIVDQGLTETARRDRRSAVALCAWSRILAIGLATQYIAARRNLTTGINLR